MMWVAITDDEAVLINERGLTWAEDIILSRLGKEHTHYIGDYDLRQRAVALNRVRDGAETP